MPLPTAYGTIPLGGALPEAYIPVDSVPLLGGALESGYGEVSYAVNMTAAASGSNGITVADDDDIDFGTGDFFLHWEGSLPDWTPASAQILVRKYTGGSAGYGLFISSSTPGRVVLHIPNSVGADTNFTSTVSNSIADGAIAKITGVCVRESASVAGSMTFYVNGIQLGTSVSIPAGVPFSASNALSAYFSGTSSTRTASNTISCIVGNFAPTAAEVLDLCTNGIPASWKWGSQTAVYTSNFSAGIDSFSASNVTLAGNIDGIGGQDNWLRATMTSAAGANHRAARSIAVTTGVTNEIRFKYYIPSGQSNVDGIGLRSDGNVAISEVFGTLDAATDVVVRVIPTTAVIRFTAYDGGAVTFTDSGADDVFYIKDIVVKTIGATMALLPDTIPTSSASEWSDTSGNTGGGTLPAAGATKVTIRK